MITIKKVQPGLVWISNGDLVVDRTVPELAEYLDVSPATVRRWLRGDPLPRAVALALKYLIGRIHSEAWREFHVDQSGRLWSSNGFGFSPGELEHFSLIMQTNRVLWRVQREREAESDRADREAVQGGDSAMSHNSDRLPLGRWHEPRQRRRARAAGGVGPARRDGGMGRD